MRHPVFSTASAIAVICLALAAPAAAQMPAPVPPGVNPVTGARPGNVPGSGQSLPLGNNASNITPGDTNSPIAPRLPSPPGGQNASTTQYLSDARSALDAGRTGEAQEALERAETDVLQRSVPIGQGNVPSQQPVVQTITRALDALGRHDLAGARQLTETAMSQVSAGG
jgi:hypothetical protein